MTKINLITIKEREVSENLFKFKTFINLLIMNDETIRLDCSNLNTI